MHTSSFKESYGRKEKALLCLRCKITRYAGSVTINVLSSPDISSFSGEDAQFTILSQSS